MNKKIIYILLAFVTLFLTGCTKGYKEISYRKLQQKLSNKETFALFIGKASCTSCDTFKDILKEKYTTEYQKQATIYYIDTDKLSDDEFNEFNTIFSYSGTPTVTIVKDGKFYTHNSVTGYTEFDNMIAKMKTNGLIKE